MHARLIRLILASSTSLVMANPAHAIICYLVYDRAENVIYQNTYPPVDMSSAGAAARDAMRARGEHMTFGDSIDCPTVVFLTGVGGTSDLRVDEVVGGMPTGGITPTASTSRGRSSGASAPARAATPAPKAATGYK